MDSAPKDSIPDSRTFELVLYDFGVRGSRTHLWRAKRAWGQAAEVERLRQGRAVLVIRPGSAKEITR